ncbi:hypothetical protein [Aeoliella sp. SH292]|uniref:hypothetical protein n=1 Tax=Aeoliella sp. SH292 TaxID=3454464 RepID=UPI003F9A533D
MMHDPCIEIETLWLHLTETPFDRDLFAAQVLEDCGHDGIGLTARQLVELLSGRDCINFEDVLWAFGELMHFYAVQSIEDAREYVRAVFVADTLARGVRAGATEWALHFQAICKFFCNASDACDTHTRAELLQRVVLRSAG